MPHQDCPNVLKILAISSNLVAHSVVTVLVQTGSSALDTQQLTNFLGVKSARSLDGVAFEVGFDRLLAHIPRAWREADKYT